MKRKISFYFFLSLFIMSAAWGASHGTSEGDSVISEPETVGSALSTAWVIPDALTDPRDKAAQQYTLARIAFEKARTVEEQKIAQAEADRALAAYNSAMQAIRDYEYRCAAAGVPGCPYKLPERRPS